VCRQTRSGFGYISARLVEKVARIFQPITKRNKGNPKQARITYDTQMKWLSHNKEHHTEVIMLRSFYMMSATTSEIP